MGNHDTSKVIPSSRSHPGRRVRTHRTRGDPGGRRSTTTSSHIAGGSKPSSPWCRRPAGWCYGGCPCTPTEARGNTMTAHA